MRKEKALERREGQRFAGGLWRFALTPRERLAVSTWISRNFRHGSSLEDFDFERFPWLREPADSASDYRIEESLLLCSPQVGKSLLAEAKICYFIGEDPGDMVAYTWTIPLAKTWSEQRVMPSIKRCIGLKNILPSDPKAYRVLEILLGHMVVEVSPANETSTQSKSQRLVLCDERSLWDPGRYDNAKRRASSPNYDGRRKIMSFSNSGKYESDVEIQWRDSDQRVLFSDCPGCGTAATFKFSEKYCRRVPKTVPGFTIHWEENSITKPDGVWKIDEVVKTVRLRCPNCAGLFEDTPRIRAILRRTMRYQALNPLASIKNRAWAVSGVAVYPWADLVKQFLRAVQLLDLGDTADMAEFILKGLNEPWSEDVIFETNTNATGDYLLSDEPWKEATTAGMAIDVQALMPYFWWAIRDFTDDGRSRLRACGSANTWEQLREIQKRENLPDRFVHVDCSFDTSTVHERCAMYGWLALRGRDEQSFLHTRDFHGRPLKQKVRRYFSEPHVTDPAIGTDEQGNPWRRRAIEIQWANTPVKDILARLYGGRGVYYGVAKDVPQFYLNHMQSERKQVVETRGSVEVRRWVRMGKRPNHLWDCEAMLIVFALMKGPLRLAAPGSEKEDKEGAE